MSKNMTLNVRITGALGDFVAESVGEYGTYENVSEYVRDLIRKDKEQVDAARMEALRAERGAMAPYPSRLGCQRVLRALLAGNRHPQHSVCQTFRGAHRECPTQHAMADIH